MESIRQTNMSLTLPYVSLRAFESVVRLRGFGRAAEELSVTQSAVSQHVKSLEEWTGHKLLVRGPRETVPTPNGQKLADAVHRGLGVIDDVCMSLKNEAKQDLTLEISCPPGFAINWLFPRLLKFDQQYPEHPVSIVTQSGPLELATGAVDAAIHYGPGGYSGLVAERLLGERVFPVCAPELLEGDRAIRSPADLVNHTLLIDDLNEAAGTPPTWEYWAGCVGIEMPRARRTRHFGQSNFVVQAARQGLGVALGREPLVIDALVAGDLVRPFFDTAESEYAYWLVSQRTRSNSKALTAFRTWLFEEARAQPNLPFHSIAGATNVGMD